MIVVNNKQRTGFDTGPLFARDAGLYGDNGLIFNGQRLTTSDLIF
jgi:hypothetical protein